LFQESFSSSYNFFQPFSCIFVVLLQSSETCHLVKSTQYGLFLAAITYMVSPFIDGEYKSHKCLLPFGPTLYTILHSYILQYNTVNSQIYMNRICNKDFSSVLVWVIFLGDVDVGHADITENLTVSIFK
jgi:hypothetical protein